MIALLLLPSYHKVMVGKVQSATVVGLEVVAVDIEVDLSHGLPGLTIVGLPDKSIEESRERVRSAIRASVGTLPEQRITVNLAPADIRKEGPLLDLPIALGILSAAGQVPPLGRDCLLVGELSLTGELKPVRGALAIAMACLERGVGQLLLPPANAAEAAIVEKLTVVPVPCLTKLLWHLKEEKRLPQHRPTKRVARLVPPEFDLSDVRGQAHGKRALEIAAAGGHNILLSGPPGTGKTLLARALPGILPPLTDREILDVTKIYSVAGLLPAGQPLMTTRPFRSPHHSISLPGLIGGGSWPRPGEMSLAHRGVLFLDELPQFPRHVIEAIRGPLEDRTVRISRAQHTLQFPTSCMLVASQNPCPCGFRDDPDRHCTCLPMAVAQYNKRISGPIRDRFDLTVEVPRLPFETLRKQSGEESADVRERVTAARRRQAVRLGHLERTNATLTIPELEQYCRVGNSAQRLLAEAVDRWQLSVRGYHRVLKVARTIADLADEEDISEAALAEALQYRQQPVAASY